MRNIFIFIFVLSFTYLNAMTTEVKDKTKELDKEIAFKKQLDEKKARQERLKLEIEKLKEALYKDKEENKFN